MFPMNVKASEQIALLGVVSPASETAGASVSGWIPVAEFQKFLAVILSGVLGTAATLDAKFQQATDSSGTGAKDVTGKALTQIVKASGDNVQAMINLDVQDLDTNNGFAYIQLSVTVGTATSLTAAAVFGFNPRFAPASDFNPVSVVQVV